MKNLKVLLVLAVLALSTSAMANNWGFYGNYNVQNIMPQQQSNGSYTFNNNSGNRTGLLARAKDKFNEMKNNLRKNSELRRTRRYARKEAFYACLSAGNDRKTCRQEKRAQRKVDLADVREARQARRAERQANRQVRRDERKQARLERRLARLDKRRNKLLSRLNGN